MFLCYVFLCFSVQVRSSVRSRISIVPSRVSEHFTKDKRPKSNRPATPVSRSGGSSRREETARADGVLRHWGTLESPLEKLGTACSGEPV